MKSNQSAICLKIEGENTTHIKSKTPPNYCEGAGLAHWYFEAWGSNHTDKWRLQGCGEITTRLPVVLGPWSRGGLGPSWRTQDAVPGAALWPNSLPSAPGPITCSDPFLVTCSVPSGPQECGSRLKLGFEGALLSPRVTPVLSETLLHSCFMAEV